MRTFLATRFRRHGWNAGQRSEYVRDDQRHRALHHVPFGGDKSRSRFSAQLNWNIPARHVRWSAVRLHAFDAASEAVKLSARRVAQASACVPFRINKN